MQKGIEFKPKEFYIKEGEFILRSPLTTKNIETLKYIIKCCNIVYNNLDNVEPLIPDELYDRLMVFAKKNNIDVPIGSPLHEEIPPNVSKIIMTAKRDHNKMIPNSEGMYQIVKKVPDISQRQFFHEMATNPIPHELDFVRNHDTTLVEKKKRATPHTWDLCGTLNKCKYVYTWDAHLKNQESDPGISIFQRDFLEAHIDNKIIDPNSISLIVSFKYDGISVENTMLNDTIVSSVTRGDLANNEASDLTPILGGMQFPRAMGYRFNDGQPFGIKFEYIMTQSCKNQIEKQFGKSYVNLRNAVIGVMNGLDARMYRDYLTPIPLESTMQSNRVDDIIMLNTYFTKGINFKWKILVGNYHDILQQVRTFVEEAASLRDNCPFDYDGIVVEYIDNNIKNILGKKNSIPQYAVAIKFDPHKKTTTFRNYSYTVGQNGCITPIAYFDPVEFSGAVYDKVSVYSYKRFMELGLRVGDKVDITLNNDIMPYLRRSPESQQDPNNTNPIIKFPTLCPSCGEPLSFSSDSGYCTNLLCPERNLSRLSNCLKKLGLKDFSEETVKTLGIKSIRELYNYPQDKMAKLLGPVNSVKLINNLEALKTANLSDARIIGAIGFSNIATRTWQVILEAFPIEEVLTCPLSKFRKLESLKGIGSRIIVTIQNERDLLLDDLKFLFDNFQYTKTQLYPTEGKVRKVCFTGFRDLVLEELFEAQGFKIVNNVSKSTDYVIVPILETSTYKAYKAFTYLAQAYYQATGEMKAIDVNNLAPYRELHLKPMVITQKEAYDMFLVNFDNMSNTSVVEIK